MGREWYPFLEIHCLDTLQRADKQARSSLLHGFLRLRDTAIGHGFQVSISTSAILPP